MSVASENVRISFLDERLDKMLFLKAFKGFIIELEYSLRTEYFLYLGFAVIFKISVNMRKYRDKSVIISDIVHFLQHPV